MNEIGLPELNLEEKNSIYNERPRDIPDCPNCKKQLSPAGGALDGSEMYWACWDCGYKQDDIPSYCL